MCQQCVTSTCGHVDSLLQKWQQEEPVAQKGTRGLKEWCAKMGICFKKMFYVFYFRMSLLYISTNPYIDPSKNPCKLPIAPPGSTTGSCFQFTNVVTVQGFSRPVFTALFHENHPNSTWTFDDFFDVFEIVYHIYHLRKDGQ